MDKSKGLSPEPLAACDMEYLHGFHLISTMESLMAQVLRDRPEDPVVFMRDRLNEIIDSRDESVPESSSVAAAAAGGEGAAAGLPSAAGTSREASRAGRNFEATDANALDGDGGPFVVLDVAVVTTARPRSTTSSTMSSPCPSPSPRPAAQALSTSASTSSSTVSSPAPAPTNVCDDGDGESVPPDGEREGGGDPPGPTDEGEPMLFGAMDEGLGVCPESAGFGGAPASMEPALPVEDFAGGDGDESDSAGDDPSENGGFLAGRDHGGGESGSLLSTRISVLDATRPRRRALSLPAPRFSAGPGVPQVAFDMGGSLCKVVVFEPVSAAEAGLDDAARRMLAFLNGSTCYGVSGERYPELSLDLLGGVLHFAKFDSRHMAGAMELFKSEGISLKLPLRVTGGGAYKHDEQLRESLGVETIRLDELRCLLAGLNFAIRSSPDECFYYPDPSVDKREARDPKDPPFPYLLVNIGTGVSILKVDAEDSYERVSGSGLGGGTFMGLARLLTGKDSFDEMLELAERGDSRRVDLLVGDIYGGDYRKFGLGADTVAACFGGVGVHSRSADAAAGDGDGEVSGDAAGDAAGGDDVTSGTNSLPHEDRGGGFSGAGHAPRPEDFPAAEDISRALLQMIANNLGQIAYLNSVRFGTRNIYFAGNFLRHNPASMMHLARGIHYWSNGFSRACFFKHEGFFGALGALLEGQFREAE